MSPRRTLVCLALTVLALPAATFAQDITNGTTEAQLRDLLGKPRGRMQNGNWTTLSYPGRMITLIDGVVTSNKFVATASRPDPQAVQEAKDRAAAERRAARSRGAAAPAPAAAHRPPADAAGDAATARDIRRQQQDELAARIGALERGEPETKEDEFRRNRELRQLRQQQEHLKQPAPADAAALQEELARVEAAITTVENTSPRTKEESSLQNQELRRLRGQLEVLRDHQQRLAEQTAQ